MFDRDIFAIQYANILHKRKYKKFKLNFVKSDNPKDDGLYIIAFQTERNKWNYTNKSYPTEYSGRLYINKENFAIVKVVETWETSLDEEQINKYFKYFNNYKDKVETTIIEENLYIYSDVVNDGKYYATEYFTWRYTETRDNANKNNNSLFETESFMCDFEVKDVEEIKYWQYDNREENSLFRVEYGETFWDLFYKRRMEKEFE